MHMPRPDPVNVEVKLDLTRGIESSAAINHLHQVQVVPHETPTLLYFPILFLINRPEKLHDTEDGGRRPSIYKLSRTLGADSTYFVCAQLF